MVYTWGITGNVQSQYKCPWFLLRQTDSYGLAKSVNRPETSDREKLTSEPLIFVLLYRECIHYEAFFDNINRKRGWNTLQEQHTYLNIWYYYLDRFSVSDCVNGSGVLIG